MISEHGHKLLARTAVFFLGCGFAARFLLLDDIHPVIEATAIGLLLLGSGLVLLQRAIVDEGPASALALSLPLLVVWAARPLDALAIKRAIDVWTACMAGFAIRDLVRRRGLGAEIRAFITSAAIILCLFGIAQTVYLRREVADVAHEMGHAITMDEQGRAFLTSWRAAATFVSANAFAGFLLLAGLPLLFVAIAQRRQASHSRTALLAFAAAIVLAGFACAGSAGATLAAAFGLVFLGWLTARGHLRAAFLAGLIALALSCFVLVWVAASSSELSGKLRTLQERLDYNKAGWRLLRATWPEGAGLEQTRLLMRFVIHGLEASSRSIHDWWLQGLVEGGAAFLPVAGMLLWTIMRGARKAAALRPDLPARERPEEDAGLSRWWWRGLLAGAVLALLLEPFVTVMPYGFGTPLLHAVVMVAVMAAVGHLVRRLDLGRTAYTRGLAAGCVAFAIHGLADFDLYVPGVMVAFAAALALLACATSDTRAAPQPASPLARALTAAFGIVSVLAPCGVILIAVTREHVH